MKSRYLAIALTALTAALLLSCTRGDTVVNTSVNSNGNTVAHDMSNMNGHDMSNMSNHDMSTMNQAMPVSAPGAAQQPYDLQFIDTMIVHHEGAIKMSCFRGNYIYIHKQYNRYVN